MEPVIGTYSSLSFLINLLKYDARFLEWFNRAEVGWPLPPYKLILDFGDTYPLSSDPANPYINWDTLIDLFELLKNERSRIITFRMNDCGNPLCLDYGVLDQDLLDSMSGYLYRGIRICMYQKHNQLIDDSDFIDTTKGGETGVTGTHYEHSFADRLDYFVFGQQSNNQINIGDFQTTYTGTKYDYSPAPSSVHSSYYGQGVLDDNWNPLSIGGRETIVSEEIQYEVTVKTGHVSSEYCMWTDISEDQWVGTNEVQWIGRD